ncbi:hypothetical protein [Chitinivorax sp. B]|uniref:hypothetical protein n=1 Tax=Chitinivorax sp. B TaxID=2502235 RepID=UPI0010F6A5ED|nr:hypothetical protein [Chitinivorax sp. B]
MFKFKLVLSSTLLLLTSSVMACPVCNGERKLSVLCFSDNPPAFCKVRPNAEQPPGKVESGKDQNTPPAATTQPVDTPPPVTASHQTASDAATRN